ncbi:hypothetical protein [Mesorhizobium sp.]|uniref:hypothetical protein n=1 Tax=Mesorhizobium sp. TaxID=1871066 RepID=UPI000FE6FA39|nr:hypothetical protein [Mesorhizobium sp.]RWO61520.1 MAG: hypothetical protein EOS14_09790 [Mesorhizobium sp.]RWO83703.1 MAG: hypothetical protein EOQ95_26215 [Mesorhizobium sp.]RWQ50188.1 MAG: hypothetical protein EOS84_22575 [Mesorhizobium sp.]TIM08868.1 MAG: hypothetical protein E5Y62_14635 [Mesorhizobium sp.]
MKDVTITMVKSEKGGYRMIVNDDTETEENAKGSKGNDSFFTFDNKNDVKEKLDEIFGNLE